MFLWNTGQEIAGSMSRLPAAKRREQLLDHAAEIFSKHGYARATTAQLAKAAGVTEPIIYRHFESKRDLFIALIERTGERTVKQWEAQLAETADPAARLRRLLGENPLVAGPNRLVYRVILQAITEVDDKGIRNALAAHIANLHAFLVRELERAQAAHRVGHRFTAEILAWLLIDVALGYGVLSAMDIGRHGVDADGNNIRGAVARLLIGKAAEEAEEKG